MFILASLAPYPMSNRTVPSGSSGFTRGTLTPTDPDSQNLAARRLGQ